MGLAVYYHKIDTRVQFEPSEYCLLSLEPSGQGVAMLCNSKLEDDNPLPHSERMLIMVFYPVSAFSLLLCLAITVSTHHLRTSMFGYMKISLLISMSAFFTVMTMMNYGGVELILNSPLLCRASGF